MSDQKETADEILERYEREAEELRAKAHEELKELADAEHAKGLADRQLRREQLYGAQALNAYRFLEARRVEMAQWSGKEAWLWAGEELLADGWHNPERGDGKLWWKRDPEDK